MPVKTFNPYTPSRRFIQVADFCVFKNGLKLGVFDPHFSDLHDSIFAGFPFGKIFTEIGLLGRNGDEEARLDIKSLRGAVDADGVFDAFRIV